MNDDMLYVSSLCGRTVCILPIKDTVWEVSMQSGRRGQQRGTGPKVKAQQNLRPRWPSPYAHRARIFHIMKMWLGKWWWSMIVTTWSNNKIQILEFSRIQDDIACTHTVKNNPFLNLGKAHSNSGRHYLDIAQIAIAPPSPHSNGHSRAFHLG